MQKFYTAQPGRNLVLASFIAFAIYSCSGDDPQVPQFSDFTLTVGDTTITIPAAAVEYAGTRLSPAHYNWHGYMLREYQIASSPSIPRDGSPYSGSLGQWKNLSWSVRATFLVPPYTRDIYPGDADFYYRIGTHMNQFGFGWSDTFNAESDLGNPTSTPWTQPSDTTLIPDNPSTLAFDGNCNFVEAYRAMWVMEY
jgi:hypothetical protein